MMGSVVGRLIVCKTYVQILIFARRASVICYTEGQKDKTEIDCE